jgi:4-aminobutyrate aminotransferase-like enzyme
VIISRDGPDENVLKIKPPLVFNEEHADMLINGLCKALDAAKESGRFEC